MSVIRAAYRLFGPVFLAAGLLTVPHTSQAELPPLRAQVDRGIISHLKAPDGWIPTRIVFSHDDSTYTVRLLVNSETYNRLNLEMEREPRPDTLVTRLQLANRDAETLAPLAEALRSIAPSSDNARLAALTLAFVQALPYKRDALTTPFDDAWRTPLQTLIDREIDCEDSAILFTGLLASLGIEGGLVLVPGHMMSAVAGDFRGSSLTYQGKDYFLAETTGIGFKIGQVAPDYQGKEAKFLPVKALTRKTPTTTTRLPGITAPPRTPPSAKRTEVSEDVTGKALIILGLMILTGTAFVIRSLLTSSGTGRKTGIQPHTSSASDDHFENPYDDQADTTPDPWDDYR